MAVPAWVVDLGKWFFTTFGADIVIWGKDKLQSLYSKMFAARNILILGPQQTGKTSLLLLMKDGHPFEVVDGQKRAPNPTAMAAVVDRRVNLDQGRWARLSKDLPGDRSLRELWAQAIEDLQPQGILYMMDGRLDDAQLQAAVDEMFRDVLDWYANGKPGPEAFHVLLSFSDRWARSRFAERSKAQVVGAMIDGAMHDRPYLHEVRIDVHVIQLSPNKEEWPEAEAALRKFGADLGSA